MWLLFVLKTSATRARHLLSFENGTNPGGRGGGIEFNLGRTEARHRCLLGVEKVVLLPHRVLSLKRVLR